MKHLLGCAALAAATLCAWASPTVAQVVTLPQVNNAGGNRVPTQGVVCVNVDGTACSFGAGGGGGDASAANQTTQISAEQAIRDQIGAISGSPTANTVQARLAAIVATLGTPLQAGGGVVSQGNVAAGSTDAGSPTKVGCRYNTTLPVYTDGQRTDCQSDATGNVRVTIGGQSTTPVDTGTAVILPLSRTSPSTAGPTGSLGYVWNGTNVIAARGDANGAYFVQKGGANLATGQISVTTSATLIAAARTGRQKITVSVGAANTCAFGASGVTTTTGFPLQPVAGATLALDTNAALYGVCSATTTISFVELY